MRRLVLVLAILPVLAACATHETKVARSIDAAVQDESQHQKVIAAAQAGETGDQALAHADHSATAPTPPAAAPR